MGTTMREVVYEIGGRHQKRQSVQGVQIGGPSGGCLTEAHMDLPMDFDSLKKAGAIIASGGLVCHGRGYVHGVHRCSFS